MRMDLFVHPLLTSTDFSFLQDCNEYYSFALLMGAVEVVAVVVVVAAAAVTTMMMMLSVAFESQIQQINQHIHYPLVVVVVADHYYHHHQHHQLVCSSMTVSD